VVRITRISLVSLNLILVESGRNFHESPKSLPQKCEKSFPFFNDFSLQGMIRSTEAHLISSRHGGRIPPYDVRPCSSDSKRAFIGGSVRVLGPSAPLQSSLHVCSLHLLKMGTHTIFLDIILHERLIINYATNCKNRRSRIPPPHRRKR
jgi:hypothetical protein